MSVLDDKQKEIDDLKNKYFSSNDLYSQYLGGENEIPDLVKTKVMAGYDNNKDTIQEENNLQEQLNTSRFSDQYSLDKFEGDPYIRAKAYVLHQANVEKRIQDIRGIREARTGTLNDIMQTVLGAYQAKTTRMGTEAQNAKGKYDIAQGEYDRMYQEEQDKKANELAWYNARKSGGGSGNDKAEQKQQKVNQALGILGSIVNYDNGGVTFMDEEEDNDGNIIKIPKNREQIAYDLMSSTGLTYDESLKTIYDNFKSAGEKIKSDPNRNMTSEPFQKAKAEKKFDIYNIFK